MIWGLCLFCMTAWTQVKNTSVEVKDYREVDGKIILEMVVNGVIADFVLDLAGHNAILPEFVEKLKIDPNVAGDFRYDSFQYKKVPVEKSVKIENISFGNSVFENEVSAFVLKDEPYLRKLGVAGVVGGALFRNVVLTIDSKRKKITMSNPYRPSYMKLDHRSNMELISASGVVCPVVLDGVTYSLLLDTWNDGMVTLNTVDFARLNGKGGEKANIREGYGDAVLATQSKVAGVCHFAQSDFADVVVLEMEKMAEKYKDQVIFLKVNADKEKELCGMFNIVALPTLFFIPVGGKPIVEMVATPEKYIEIIENQLLKK